MGPRAGRVNCSRGPSTRGWCGTSPGAGGGRRRGRPARHRATNASDSAHGSGTLDWTEICREVGVPQAMLGDRPLLRCAGRVVGRLFGGTPIAGSSGISRRPCSVDRAAPGDTKNTYGTGAFLLLNTERRSSAQWPAATVGYQLGATLSTRWGSWRWPGRWSMAAGQPGGDLDGRRDGGSRLLARDSGDCYLVPAFSGLLAPRWRPDARGVMVGLTRFHTRAHLARARWRPRRSRRGR